MRLERLRGVDVPCCCCWSARQHRKKKVQMLGRLSNLNTANCQNARTDGARRRTDGLVSSDDVTAIAGRVSATVSVSDSQLGPTMLFGHVANGHHADPIFDVVPF